MLHDDRRIFDHYPVSDTDLVNRINRALSGKGLRVQRTRPESSGAGVPALSLIHICAGRKFRQGRLLRVHFVAEHPQMAGL